MKSNNYELLVTGKAVLLSRPSRLLDTCPLFAYNALMLQVISWKNGLNTDPDPPITNRKRFTI